MPLVEEHEEFPCPWCKQGVLAHAPVLGRAAREQFNAPGARYTYSVFPADEFFRAVRGVGLPGEYGASPELVEGLFALGRVTAVDIEPVDDSLKTVIHSIRLALPEGQEYTLHLGPSTKGALFYRVEEHHGSRRNDHGAAGTDRAQAGSDPARPERVGDPRETGAGPDDGDA